MDIPRNPCCDANAFFAVVPLSEGSRVILTLVPRGQCRCVPSLLTSARRRPRRDFFVLLQKATPPGSKCAVPAAPVSAPVTKIPVRKKQQTRCHYSGGRSSTGGYFPVST